MPEGRERSRLAEQAWIAINHVIVVGMLLCAAVPAIRLGERLMAGWDGRYLLVACGLVALEALLAERVVRALVAARQASRMLLYRAAELVLILTGLKLAQSARRGLDALWAELSSWPQAPLAALDGEFWFGSILLLAVWTVGGLFAAGLMTLEGDERALEHEREAQIAVERAEARRQLRGHVFAVGAAVLVLTAIVRVDLSAAGLQVLAPLSSGLGNVLLYFGLGFLLLSQSQFAILRAQWARERIVVSPRLAWRWAGYSLALLLGVAALVSVLPTRYSFGLLDTLQVLITGLVMLVYLLFFFLTLPLMLLASLMMNWLSRFLNLGPPPTLPQPVPPPVEAGAGLSWTEWLRSLVFWAVFLAVLGFSLVYFLRQRPGVLSAVRRLPGWAWLLRSLRALGGGWRRLGREAVDFVRAGLRRFQPSAHSGATWRYLSLRRLSPRDQVRFYYRALVRRSRESGLPRRPAQTPYEYGRDLERALPEEAEPLSSITEAFVEAQYSTHDMTAQAARAARARWDQLRKALRARRR